jgi:hypothetical protein
MHSRHGAGYGLRRRMRPPGRWKPTSACDQGGLRLGGHRGAPLSRATGCPRLWHSSSVDDARALGPPSKRSEACIVARGPRSHRRAAPRHGQGGRSALVRFPGDARRPRVRARPLAPCRGRLSDPTVAAPVLPFRRGSRGRCCPSALVAGRSRLGLADRGPRRPDGRMAGSRNGHPGGVSASVMKCSSDCNTNSSNCFRHDQQVTRIACGSPPLSGSSCCGRSARSRAAPFARLRRAASDGSGRVSSAHASASRSRALSPLR